MSDPSADDKRLARMRKDGLIPNHPTCECGMCTALRLLDAAQARLTQSETRANNWRHDFLREEREKRAAEERASALEVALRNIAQRANESAPGPSSLLETIHSMHAIAREALAQSEAPKDAHAPQTTNPHESGDKG